MHVVVTDRRFSPDDPRFEAEPFTHVVESAGSTIEYHDFETESEVVEGCREADIVLTSKAPMTGEVIAELDRTRAIIRTGTGYDTINVKAATERGISVSNVPGSYCRHDLSTHAIGLMIAATHEIVSSDQDMRAADGFGERRILNPAYGGTFGVLGFGHVGRATVPKAQGFDMDVLACDPYVPADVMAAFEVEKVQFSELLRRSDCVSIHAPLTAETHHLFSTPEFGVMQETAVLVNTARGPIIDETALLAALDDGEIWAAGLDVFETEPPTGTPVLDHDRVVCSPHRGAKSLRAGKRNYGIVREELTRLLAGEHPENVVNPEVFTYTDELLNPERYGRGRA